MVFEEPNSGRPSMKLRFPSRGHAKWFARIRFEMTGAPFASVTRTKSCRMDKYCIVYFISR
jgi:hypothetical protein